MSSAFSNGTEIPEDFGCVKGNNDKPSIPLLWAKPPPTAKSFVVLMHDPDAIPVVGLDYIHWLVVDIPPSTFQLGAGASNKDMPEGAIELENSRKTKGYTPPCPPTPQVHTYRVHVYARAEEKTTIDTSSRDARDVLKQLEEGNVGISDELDGLYHQPGRY
eukprot:CAMPEP_0168515394 /NCGR_PEP_ID=MMETSP0405-20121227/4725_1 /TAXON_ID=498012 /ORGANISM="Trichosphaerium sp, Strain Am-I-7 wt" /LENGTH=160 /DNA_ID=CAMNT_0008534795 /DNA_START=181 /DNA_END=663 /DNA_ORIENTATION=-